MSEVWPWLVVAGFGALHGLNPASGWLPAAMWGLQSRDRRQALWALIPIAAGHAASVTLVALGVAFGVGNRLAAPTEGLAVLLLACAFVYRIGPPQRRAPVAHAGLALGSFWMASAHGAVLMLVPVLAPLCVTAEAARELTATGPGLVAVAAVLLHTGAMLAVTGALALGACSSSDVVARVLRSIRIQSARRLQ